MAGICNDGRCRFYQDAVESVNCLISGCKVLLADGHYMKTHKRVCRYAHWIINKNFGLINDTKIWKHEPKSADENNRISFLWLITLRRCIEDGAIKPNIVVWNKEEKTALKQKEKIWQISTIEIWFKNFEIKTNWDAYHYKGHGDT